MYKVILCNSVAADGIGDLQHFLDIYFALINNPRMEKFEFIPVICSYYDDDKCNYAKIATKLKASNIPFYFFGDMPDFNTFKVPSYIHGEKTNLSGEANKALLQQHFSEAVQIIVISYDAFADEEQYMASAHPKALFKHIGDHEAKRDSFDKKRWLYRSMGLTKDQYGIKIAETPALLPSEAFSIISKHDKIFTDTLLKQTNTSDWNSFDGENYLVVAYFHHKNHNVVSSFIKLLTANEKLPKKNLAIYLSSNVLTKMLAHLDKSFGIFIDEPLGFEGSDIKQIEIFTFGDSQPKIYPINQKHQKIVRIFCGFDLCNDSFHALFKCVFMAAISGDNTFEHAVANETLPYYWSTNYSPWKSLTLVALQNIIKLPTINIPHKVKQDFLLYFDPNKYPLDSLQYKQLDLIAMAKAWPTIAKFIKKNLNFYDNLEAIFFDKLNLSLFQDNSSSTGAQSNSGLTNNKARFFQTDESISIRESAQKKMKLAHNGETQSDPICIMQFP